MSRRASSIASSPSSVVSNSLPLLSKWLMASASVIWPRSTSASMGFTCSPRLTLIISSAVSPSWVRRRVTVGRDAPMSLPIVSAVTRCPVADLYQSR
nr:MAG TPA: hypothetical protein [Caudoviricetes sp.]